MSDRVIKTIETTRLIPYARNAKKHNDSQISAIAGSIKEFGFNNPVLVDDGGGIIAGHGRVLAAQRLGLSNVPCIVLDHLNDTQRRAYILADNKLAEIGGGWDAEMLKIEIGELDDEIDLTLAGFHADEIAEILADDENLGKTDQEDVPEITQSPVTEVGDVWNLGKHRLMCGDSTSIDQLSELCGGLVNLWLTDPPYNVALGYDETPEEAKRRNRRTDGLTVANDSMSDTEFRQFLTDCYTAADSVMLPGASFYIWHADSEGYNFRGAAFDMGWRIRQCLIWVKQTMVMGRQDYHWKHEPCLYGWKEGAGHTWESDRKQTTILEFDRPSRNKEHPTMKPVDLFEYQIKNNTKAGMVVLDSFGGSGTTMIACEKSGREARLMELDPKYCDVIIKRWQDFTGKDATLERTGEAFNSMVK